MAEVEPPVRLPGACDPTAELDLAQMGDDDALAGLGSGVHFAWQEIQQLMDSATDEPLSDTLLEACANAALDGAPLHAGAPPPLLHLNEVSGDGDLTGHKRQWAATQAAPPTRGCWRASTSGLVGCRRVSSRWGRSWGRWRRR